MSVQRQTGVEARHLHGRSSLTISAANRLVALRIFSGCQSADPVNGTCRFKGAAQPKIKGFLR